MLNDSAFSTTCLVVQEHDITKHKDYISAIESLLVANWDEIAICIIWVAIVLGITTIAGAGWRGYD